MSGQDRSDHLPQSQFHSLGNVIDGLLCLCGVLGFGSGPSSFFLGPWSFVWDLVLELLVDVVVGDLQDGEEVLVDPGIICSLVGTLQGLRYSQ